MQENVANEGMTRLRVHVQAVSDALPVWAGRDDSKAQPEVRRAGGDALAAIDGALVQLHELRRLLIGQLRASDDAGAARVDALLYGGRARRLCAHADRDGEGMHWLEPGQVCTDGERDERGRS